jgi:AmmeMemoRadiSam system protein B/AmmeMemoRadiSam system protein A
MMKITFILTIFAMLSGFFNSDSPSVRPAAVAGQFYPADKAELQKLAQDCIRRASSIAGAGKHEEHEGAPAAVIVPHAGYVFSGTMAALAFSTIPEDSGIKRIFIIGPSHHVWLDGASVDKEYDFYETPLGRVPVDKEACEKLISNNKVMTFRHDAHSKEHCLEVQLPLLQTMLGEVPPIVPIIVGTEKYPTIKAIAEALEPYLTEKGNLFVISSDFSHYPRYGDACKADSLTADAIATGDPARFVAAIQKNAGAGYPGLVTSACGQSAILALMLMTSHSGRDFEYQHLGYENSGDSPYGGKDEVVGYNAFAVWDKGPKANTETKTDSSFSLTDSEKTTLLRIARSSISGAFDGKDVSEAWSGETLTPSLKENCGAFVTLNEKGRLRGCIGHFGEDTPLYRTVASMARAAAFDDYRFNEVAEDEMSSIDIEISVLTPLKKISSPDEFHYGDEGIYMRLGGRSGTFLPQVAQETGWTKEEFLGHCAQDKAGIGWDGWRRADLYTYKAIIFHE